MISRADVAESLETRSVLRRPRWSVSPTKLQHRASCPFMLAPGAQGAGPQWMVGMGIGGVVMAVVMAVAVVMARIVPMAVAPQGDRDAIGLAGAGAFVLAEITAFAEAFDVVVMAVLGGAHLQFEAQHLGPVLA